jgi:hypothetical protein
MQPITDSARGMVNTVYDSLLNGEEVTGMGEAEQAGRSGHRKCMAISD